MIILRNITYCLLEEQTRKTKVTEVRSAIPMPKWVQELTQCSNTYHKNLRSVSSVLHLSLNLTQLLSIEGKKCDFKIV